MTIGEGWNARAATGDPTAHAEILVLRAAARALEPDRLHARGEGRTVHHVRRRDRQCPGRQGGVRLLGAENRCGRVVWDVLRDRRLTHRVEVRGGVREDDCAERLREFFATHR